MSERKKLKVILVTGRTVKQGFWKEYGKFSKAYMESVSVCYMDARDMERLGIKDGTNVQVSTKHGSTILKALKSTRGKHSGIIFVPYGPWINGVVDPETDSVGMPSFKGTQAEVEPAPENPVLSLEELLKKQFRKLNDENR